MHPIFATTTRTKLKFYTIMSHIASVFAAATSDNYETSINESLRVINDFVKADRAYIFRYDFKAKTCSNTYEYCGEGITKEIHNLQDIPLEGIPEWVETHQLHETMYIADVMKLPVSANVRQILEPQGVLSLITLPLFHHDELYGFIGFDSVKRHHKYSKFEQYVLTEYSALLVNVLDRIELDTKLHEQQLRTSFLAQAANLGTWEWDTETNEIALNEIWAKNIGYTLSELGPTNLDTWKQYTHPDDLPHALEAIKKYMNGETPFYQSEFRMINKDGTYSWVRDMGSYLPDKDNHRHLMLGAHFDITEIKNEETNLRVITQAIEQSPSAVVITNEKNYILYANQQITSFTGYSVDELIGKSPRIFKSGYHNDDFYKELYTTVNEGKIWKGEFRNRRKDGSLYWESTSIAGVFDTHHRLTHYIAVKIDISERKAQEEALAVRRQELEQAVEEQLQEIQDSQQSAIIALAKLTESRDEDTGHHLERVQHLCKTLASSLKDDPKHKKTITSKFLNDIYFASALHDIGKVKTPDAILLKPGKLSPEEIKIMQEHVAVGEKILADMVRYYPKSSLIVMGQIIAKYHHERWNGKGYLEGLSGESIPLPARIMALVDVYDALRSKRPYKDGFTHQKTVEIIQSESGSHFDPSVVEAFMRIELQFDMIYTALNT